MVKDYSSIIVSSRVKLSRNLLGFEFPSEIEGDEGIKVLNKLADNILKIDSGFKLYKMQTLPELDVNIMHEKGLISMSLMDSFSFGAVILSEDEEISIMLNEMDHIVETYTMSGLNLIKAYEKLNQIDNQIISKLDIAFDDNLGFLTSSINDVGTGLRASVDLFLPALTITGKIKEIISNLSNQGIKLGFADDGIDLEAYTYTLSNAQTIGRRENEYVVGITEIAIKISEMEIRARNELLSATNFDNIKDKVQRAWGILTNCYKIDVAESKMLLGDIKIGVALDLIRFKEVDFIDNLMIDVLPYSLTKISGSKVTDSDLDKFRATFLTNILKSKRIK
ncbi:MAG: hypothetical protein IKD36_01270 [Clostridia bacterium]|nr:hypothetical protein [Clostridia bacterium]